MIMQLVLVSRERLIDNAMAVDREFASMILNSMTPWHLDAALVLFLEAVAGRAPVN